MDLICLNGEQAQHIVHTETNVRNAVFIKRKAADDLWIEFVDSWASFYTGLPEIIRQHRDKASDPIHLEQ